MKVYWWQGNLTIQPETEAERSRLNDLSRDLCSVPPEMRSTIPGGATELGSDGLFEAIVRNHQTVPGRFPVQANNIFGAVGKGMSPVCRFAATDFD